MDNIKLAMNINKIASYLGFCTEKKEEIDDCVNQELLKIVAQGDYDKLVNCYSKLKKSDCSNDDIALIVRYIVIFYNGDLTFFTDEFNASVSRIRLMNSMTINNFDHYEMFVEEIFNFSGLDGVLKFMIDFSRYAKEYYNTNKPELDTYCNILSKIFNVKKCRRAIKHYKLSKLGSDESKHGLFCWMDVFHPTTDIRPIIKIFNCYYEDVKGLKTLLKKLCRLYSINIALTHDNAASSSIKNCTSMPMLYIFFRILLNITNTQQYDNLEYIEKFPRSEFKLNQKDDVGTMLLITTSFAFFVCNSSQIQICKYLEDVIRGLEGRRQPIREHTSGLLEEYKKKFAIIKSIVTSKQYRNEINNFLTYYITTNLHVNDDMCNSIIFNTEHETISLESESPGIVYDYLINVIGGYITKNPALRCTVLDLYKNIVERKGFMGKHDSLYVSLNKFLIDVNIRNLYHNPQDQVEKHKNIVEMMIKITKCKEHINVENNVFLNGMYKLISCQLEFADDLKKDIGKRSVGILNVFNFTKVKATCHIIEISLTLLKKMCETKIKIPDEVIMHIGKLCDSVLDLMIDKKLAILEFIEFFCCAIDKFRDNNCFKNECRRFVTYLELIGEASKKSYGTKIYEFSQEIKNTVVDEIEYPDEFLDPILCIPIKNPVMIPKVTSIFDRISITSQIMHEKINPYTREQLTIEEFEEYNEKPEVKKQIIEFKKKFTEWSKKI